MSDSWDDNADTWDTDSKVIDYSNQAFESLLEIVDLNQKTVFDFGCGTGLLTERMSPLTTSIVALDSSPKMIEVLSAKKLKHVTVISDFLSKELINNSPALSEKFNLVVASSVLSFVPDYNTTLHLLKSLLLPGGVFIQWDWLSPEDDPNFGFSETVMKETLSTVGFKDIVIKQPFSIAFDNNDMQVLMGIGNT